MPMMMTLKKIFCNFFYYGNSLGNVTRGRKRGQNIC